jgi:hypothetical protein
LLKDMPHHLNIHNTTIILVYHIKIIMILYMSLKKWKIAAPCHSIKS